ncbi:hypothetical protein [Neobacillus cucumis]|uniref:hypothetical protein n=1 Tax=Neobacillus cucumis TaxID=1740721 RepID=UPI001963D3A6|nr:hypothetical protein [Neobacillus cucumis]MBM7655619.1 hypothetical protein [Neobacillus cucumis]
MKKLITIIGGLLVAVSLFVTYGNTAKAEEATVSTFVTSQNEDCACHDVTPILGAERNKIVADLISNNEFKTVKKDLMSKGYKWLGASEVQVYKHNQLPIMIVGLPFKDSKGTKWMATFLNGDYQGNVPLE